MSLTRKRPMLWVVLAIPVIALGCSGNKVVDPEVQLRNSELSEIYDSYMMYVKTNQKPPRQLSDLKASQAINGMGLQAVKDGRYVVVWGTDVSGKDPSKVVAYEKDAPKQGGAVLMADGTVKNMSADELQAALKTKG